MTSINEPAERISVSRAGSRGARSPGCGRPRRPRRPTCTPLPRVYIGLVPTVLGWQVPDIEIAVADLKQNGVGFERFEQLPQDELGIWTTPTGAKVAWFKDPDGNILSVSEHPDWEK